MHSDPFSSSTGRGPQDESDRCTNNLSLEAVFSLRARPPGSWNGFLSFFALISVGQTLWAILIPPFLDYNLDLAGEAVGTVVLAPRPRVMDPVPSSATCRFPSSL